MRHDEMQVLLGSDRFNTTYWAHAETKTPTIDEHSITHKHKHAKERTRKIYVIWHSAYFYTPKRNLCFFLSLMMVIQGIQNLDIIHISVLAPKNSWYNYQNITPNPNLSCWLT